MSPIRVSAVVPVWNPGPSFTRCVDSLLAQDLAPDEYEIILVDDGSTDGTADLLDELAVRHSQVVRVIHIPNSGWPGRPRNVGIDAARGEFVHLVDNDDSVPPYALRALCEVAEQRCADVAFGTPASDFRGLNHTLYRDPLWVGTLADRPDLTYTLTPHKMFRRSLLVRHGIRFPEGPVPLEDQFFVLAAYVHARAIAVLADRCYYRYLRRLGSGRNAGDRPLDAALQCGAVDELAALVSETVPPGPLRDRLLRRFLVVNLLPLLVSRAFTEAGESDRRELMTVVHGLVQRRFPIAVRDRCGAAHRVQIQSLLAQDLEALTDLAHTSQTVQVRVEIRQSQWQDGRWVLDLHGAVQLRDAPLRCDRTVGGWALPAAVFPHVAEDHRRLDPERDVADVELGLVSRNSSEFYGTTSGLSLTVADDGAVVLGGTVVIDPLRLAAGSPLDDGVWDLVLRMRWAGWNRAGAARLAPDVEMPPPLVTGDGRVVIPTVVGGHRGATLDVGQWQHSLVSRVARDAVLSAPGRRRLLLRTHLASATASLPAWTLSLAAHEDDRGLVVLPATLTACGGVGEARCRLPRGTPDGRWVPWLAPADLTARPVRLPWVVTTAGSEVRVTPSGD